MAKAMGRPRAISIPSTRASGQFSWIDSTSSRMPSSAFSKISSEKTATASSDNPTTSRHT
jgi:hypothetical protein